jgi:transcriptional regulator with XRE-family HTH domain
MTTTRSELSAFCDEVRRRRQALGLTLEALAQRSGLTPNYIGTIEIGKRDPSLTTVAKIATGLGIETSELFGGSGGLSAAAVEAGRLFEMLPSDLRAPIEALVRVFVRRRRG